MLSKDKAFDINEFVYQNSNNKLWQVSEKLTEIISDLANNDGQKNLINSFLVKNGYKKVCEIEKSIYDMVGEVINYCEVVELVQEPE